MSIRDVRSVDLKDKRVLIRVDFNVPVRDGVIQSDARIQAALQTIDYVREQGGCVMLISHFGRPAEGEYDSTYSLAPVADYLSEHYGQSVPLVKDWLSGEVIPEPGHIMLCENVRFNLGEQTNDDGLARTMAEICDIFVNDAFGTAHRAQASTVGVAKYAPVACAGILMQNELDALANCFRAPKRPLVAIVGGAKVSTKFKVLSSLKERVDQLIVGGGIANTFLAATGHPVGQSLYEPDWVDEAKSLIQSTYEDGGMLPLPTDVVVGKTFTQDTPAEIKDVSSVESDDMIMDVGPQSCKKICELIQDAGTVIWNGPLGVFEFDNFSEGTRVLAKAIEQTNAYTLAGGGDTLNAAAQFNMTDSLDYISTGGGAFLEYLEGKVLPAVEILEKRSKI